MNATGKAARRKFGNRFAAKAAKTRRPQRKAFGKLNVSVQRGNAEAWVREHGGDAEPEPTPESVS